MRSHYHVGVEEEMKRSDKLRLQDIEEIQQWMSSQPHLPSVPDVQLAHFLHASCYDVKLAKKTIEHNFTFKSSVTQLFDNWDPRTNGTVEYVRSVMTFVLLPKLTSSDPRVLLFRFHNPSVQPYDFSVGAKWSLMSLQSLLFHEGQQREFKIVVDSVNYSFAHVLKNPLHLLKAYNDYGMNAIEIKVSAIHFINSSSVIKRLIAIIKPFLGTKGLQMLHFHTSPDGFFKSMPLEAVPSDYGGTGKSLAELQEENISRVEETDEALVAYSELRTNESKRTKMKKGTLAAEKRFLQELD